MSKFKAGDRVKCIDDSGAPEHFRIGEYYTISVVDDYTGGYSMVRCVGDRGCLAGMFGTRFELAPKPAPTYDAGEPVIYNGTGKGLAVQKGATGEAKYVWPGDGIVYVQWDRKNDKCGVEPNGAYDTAWFDKYEPAPKNRGDIIVELRKRAGLPPFTVGDVVNYTLHRGGWQGVTVETEGPLYNVTCPIQGRGFLVADHMELVKPASSAVTKKQPLKFKVGDYVRLVDGVVCKVSVVDTARGDWMYFVTEIADAFAYCWRSESELETWTPKVGERVEIVKDHDGRGEGWIGTVAAIDNDDVRYKNDVVIDGLTDGHEGEARDDSETHWYFPDDALIPTAVAEPVEEPMETFKRGDIVEVVEGFDGDAKVGDLGIVTDNESPYYVTIANDNGFIDTLAFAREIRHAA